MTTGFLYNERYLDHGTGPNHPEHAGRLNAIMNRLETSGLIGELDRATPGAAPLAAIEAVHDATYVRELERTCRDRPGLLGDINTVASVDSYEVARLAAGGALEAVDGVMSGRWRNAFLAARPPGHHAERGVAMGFCLFNNVAVAAEHLRAAHGLERIAIVDWDVHHGNGTQHLFESDPGVLYASLHQFPHYPGTGAADERGVGAGLGTTLNLPMEAGSGDSEWLRELEGPVVRALEDFDPQFLLVSAGFDAHSDDPLANTRVSVAGFRRMSEVLLDVARRRCEGRLVSMLEGGYDLAALAASVETHVEALHEAE